MHAHLSTLVKESSWLVAVVKWLTVRSCQPVEPSPHPHTVII